MKNISEIDKNFAVPTLIDKEDIVWFDAGQESDNIKIYGAYSKNPYLRMPEDVAVKVSDKIEQLNTYTAGIRARFACDSPYIAIHVEFSAFRRFSHMTSINQAGFDLYYQDADICEYAKTFRPPLNVEAHEKGYDAIVEGLSGYHDYILNFPCYNDVERLFIGVSKTAVLGTPKGYRDILPIVYYGSSITQGGCASRPGNTYQNFLARWLDTDYINLGFSGSARAEQELADYMANLAMSVFVSDYDHNASAEHLEKTHFNLYKTVRAKNPQLPYVMITRPDFRHWAEEDVRRKEIVMESFKRGVEEGDKNLYFIDGEKFFGDFERFAHTVDGIHPNDLGFYKMAEGIYPTLAKILGGKRD